MANKYVAVFLICIAMVAALQMIQYADADDDHHKGHDHKSDDCFGQCESDCKANGYGQTLCDMKCGSKCTAKEAAAKIGIHVGN